MKIIRQLQKKVTNHPYITKQDYELLEYIKQNKISKAYGFGQTDFFNSYVEFVNEADFGIIIINNFFQFDWLVKFINQILQNNISHNGIIYLAINKFLAEPIHYIGELSDNYDLALKEFFEKEINASIISYTFSATDVGNKFNFTHPLSRFYLKKNENC